MRADLAQPSGLATDGRLLYVADSENSSIRAADIDPHGAVETLAGGELFDFGDADGIGLAARFSTRWASHSMAECSTWQTRTITQSGGSTLRIVR